MKLKPNIPYVIQGALFLSASALFVFLFDDLIVNNSDARDVIVTVFSILAGFLIAIMTLLGDHSLVPGGWRIAEVERRKVHLALTRQKALFWLYLIVLLLIFVGVVIDERYVEAAKWVARVYFGLGFFAFLVSFSLPQSLMAVQMKRFDAATTVGRARASKLDK